MSACKIVGASKPNVWHDGDQWQCDQTTQCLTCGSIDMKRLADDDATWKQALASARRALPMSSHEHTQDECCMEHDHHVTPHRKCILR